MGSCFNSQYKSAVADAYGNVYQFNGTGSGTGAPGIYASAAFAGGAPLTNLLTVEAPFLSPYYGPASPTSLANGGSPAELPLTYGNAYIFIGDPAINSGALINDFPAVLVANNENFDIRPASMVVDAFRHVLVLRYALPGTKPHRPVHVGCDPDRV